MQNCGLVFLGSCSALTALELGVRWFSPQPPLIYRPDSVLGWTHIPNHNLTYPGHSGSISIHFNSKGLRDVEHPYKKRSDVYRILVLGDSYTEGVDVELTDTFSKRLEILLNARGLFCEVINAGVGGYGTDQELIFLTREGWKYDPDLVIVAFTIDNDVHDNVAKGYCKENSTGLVCAQKTDGMRRRMLIRFKAFAQRHFQSYFFVREKTSRLYALRSILSKLEITEFHNTDDMTGGLPVQFHTLLRQPSKATIRGWQLTTAILRRMNSEAQQHGASFLMVTIPSRLQVEEDILQHALEAARLDISDLDLGQPNRILLEFGTAHNVPVIDLLPVFRAATMEGIRLSGGPATEDGHWNKAGHALAAEIICQQLVRTSAMPKLKVR